MRRAVASASPGRCGRSARSGMIHPCARPPGHRDRAARHAAPRSPTSRRRWASARAARALRHPRRQGEPRRRRRAGGPATGPLRRRDGGHPTPLGEGKTTTTVGLGQALACIGRQATIAIRQASMGPTFGIKGGAAGGGYSQVVPFENLNLHLTGDLHAVTAANNLLAAMVDNHLYNGNALGLDPHGDHLEAGPRRQRPLAAQHRQRPRHQQDGIPRRDGVRHHRGLRGDGRARAGHSLRDLRERMGRIVVGYTADGEPVTAEQLKAAGAMTVIMRDAIKPNLLQTLEHTPGPRPRRPVRQHRPRQLVGRGRPDRHPRRRVPRHRGRLRRRHGGRALLQHQVPHLGPGARRRRGRDDGARHEAALGPAPGRGRSPAPAGHAGGEPRGGAARRGQPAGPPGHRAPPRRHARGRHQRHSRATSRPSTPPSGRSPPRSGARAAVCTHFERRRQGGGRAGRGGRRGGGGAGRVPHALRRRRHAAPEDRGHRHRGLRGRRRRLPAGGGEPARHLRAGRVRLACRCASPRRTSPSPRTRRSWAPRGAGACPSARPGPMWGPGSSTWSAATCAPCPGCPHSPAAERIDIDESGNVVGLY